MNLHTTTQRLIERTSKFVITTVASIRDWYNNALIFTSDTDLENKESNTQYGIAFNEYDEEYILSSARILRQYFGEKPVERLLEIDAQERAINTELMMTELMQIYELRGINIQFVFDSHSNTCGGYSYSEQSITLNLAPLMTDNRTLVTDYLDTIFHELRHAVQWHIMQNNNRENYRWNGDAERVNEYAIGFLNYIPANQDPEGYYNQYVERESRAFAAAILKYAGV